MHHLGKQLEFPHHELERSDLLSGLLLGLGFGFQPGCPAAQLSEARFELGLLDQALRVAVDQPLDGAARLRQLTAESIEFELVRGGLDRIQAALILFDDPCRVVEQPTDLAPYRLIEPIDRNQAGIASPLAVEPGAVGAATAIVTPGSTGMIPGKPIATLLADEQTSQQILNA
ncbi:hypothetical protein U0023_26560 (plasmid) [Microvirga lotononidis]|uniref:Uncharacterized protein n=1 Tax=Microvirga lotononidis TaxID=864069 RepID=I4Z4V9_9HYPH|nr:hypothetical protein [Microvirga lotononidis]EIM31251.1 hypothetical protein MicloDRAFT_00002410 [Microvirga lotononidis]WQO29984.1 hypothetical protein U0023_26560 [Microvirga lotononidis]